MARKSFVVMMAGTMILFLCSVSSADVPGMINYQGKLTTAQGGCLNDTVQMIFSIYPDTLGSPAEWIETHGSIVVKEGIFNVLLGSGNPIPDALFDGGVKFLGVRVESDPEMTPLKPMVSVPYAYRAGTADGGAGGGGWVDDGTVVRLEDSTDQVGIGTSNPSPGTKLYLKDDGYAYLEFDHGRDTTWLVGSNLVDNQNLQILQRNPYGSVTRAAFTVDGEIYLLPGGGKVGIGTSPRENLDIAAYPGGGKLAISNPDGTIEAGDTLGEIKFYGQDGGDQVGAKILSSAVEEWIPWSSGGDLRFLTTPSGSSTPVERVTISDDGNVGIGTTSPTEELDVAGTAQMTGFKMPTAPGDGYVLTSDAAGVGTWQPVAGLGDNDWSFRVTDTADTTLVTGGPWGIARYGNELYGNADSTHINLGVACTTGTSGQNYKYCTVGGGHGNTASGSYATVGGGYFNTAGNEYATVGGGVGNTASGYLATVGGGFSNTATNARATVGGGSGDTASGNYSTVPGGRSNKAAGDYSFAAGRRAKANHPGSFVWADNTNEDFASTDNNQFLIRASGGVGIGTDSPGEELDVAGTVQMTGFKMPTGAGSDYVLTSDASGVGTWQPAAGGQDNDWAFRITDTADTTLITGGAWGIARYGNELYGNADSTHVNLGVACTTGTTTGQNYKYCSVGGGVGNAATGERATVGGGGSNSAGGNDATVGGGWDNSAAQENATVAGGCLNTASGWAATVPGGYIDTASGFVATVGGGTNNTASGDSSTVGGGSNNTASADAATVGGGAINFATADRATVSGGAYNNAIDFAAAVGGGTYNVAAVFAATVGGGMGNLSGDTAATVGGGSYNKAWGKYSVIAGGGGGTAFDSNSAHGQRSVIGGGFRNIASNDFSIVAGGGGNTSSGIYSTIGGGSNNQADKFLSTVGGGGGNYANGILATIGGGDNNTAFGYSSVIAGGHTNRAYDTAGTVGGGRHNKARGKYSVVGGGGGADFADSNSALGDWSTISGGRVNTTSQQYATVGGGRNNTASGANATVGGGWYHTASGGSATVGGGYFNEASGIYATVGGGRINTASGDSSAVGGGSRNTASADATTIGGGWHNTASYDYATVGGGYNGTAEGYAATVGGGRSNSAGHDYATVGGGWDNFATGYLATIGGGRSNVANGDSATVAGGAGNTASGRLSTVGGGLSNTASKLRSTVGGGYYNTAGGDYGDYATVGGGLHNSAEGSEATVGGGWSNTAGGSATTVGGGKDNTAYQAYATVGGGFDNNAYGFYSTVPGGYADTAAGVYSFASGSEVVIRAAADYTFAFGRDFETSTPNAVIFFHNTGSTDSTKVGINKTNPAYGIDLPNSNSNYGKGRAYAWPTYSSKRWKENIRPIESALAKVMKLRGVYFDWKESKNQDIGMIAEEVGEIVPEVVTYEQNSTDAQALDYARLTALLVEAIKEQQKEIELLKAKVQATDVGSR